MSKFNLSKPWIVALIMGLSLIGGYYLVRMTDWSAVRRLDGLLLLALLIIALVYMLVNTLSTWILLHSMGYSTHFGKLYLVVTSSLSTNYITPVKAGIPVRLWLYKSLMGIPVSSGSASMVVETTLGLSLGVILSLLGTQSILRSYNIGPYLALFSLLIAVAGISLFLRPKLASSFVEKLLPSKYVEHITNWISQFSQSIKSVPVRTLGKMVLLYLVRLVTRAFCLHMILQDMGAFSSVLDLVFAQSISGVIGILSMLPMGIGAKDASLTVLIIQLGVAREVALVGALVDRFLWTFVPLIAGIISANVLGISDMMKSSDDNSAAQ